MKTPREKKKRLNWIPNFSLLITAVNLKLSILLFKLGKRFLSARDGRKGSGRKWINALVESTLSINNCIYIFMT